MNLRALEAFYWIVRLGTFHAAAARLNTSQPAISARIRELESELAVNLFDRIGRIVQVTPKGRELVEHATRVIGEVERLRQRASVGAAASGVVRVGAGEILSTMWLPSMLTELRRRYPELLIDLEIGLTMDLRHQLDRGEIDVALLAAPLGGIGLKIAPLIRVEMCWMSSRSMVAPGRHLTVADVANLPIITLSRHSHLFSQLTEWCDSHRVTPRQLHVCNSVAMMIKLVAEGFGISVLPRSLVSHKSDVRELRELGSMPPIQFVSAIHTKNIGRPPEIVAQLAATFAGRRPTRHRAASLTTGPM
jgi:DNA-binding transcriptional LysR family regulator